MFTWLKWVLQSAWGKRFCGCTANSDQPVDSLPSVLLVWTRHDIFHLLCFILKRHCALLEVSCDKGTWTVDWAAAFIARYVEPGKCSSGIFLGPGNIWSCFSYAKQHVQWWIFLVFIAHVLKLLCCVCVCVCECVCVRMVCMHLCVCTHVCVCVCVWVRTFLHDYEFPRE